MKVNKLSFLIFFLPVLLSAQTLENLDQIGPFHEGLAAIQKGSQWGFMNTKGELVVDFRKDLLPSSEHENYPVFVDERCRITRKKEGIMYFGYIDPAGKTIIEPQFLNATNFKDGNAIVLKLRKEVAGKNDALGKSVIYYRYNEVIITKEGEIVKYLTQEGKNVVLDKDYLKNPPQITFKHISPNLFAQKDQSNLWQLISL